MLGWWLSPVAPGLSRSGPVQVRHAACTHMIRFALLPHYVPCTPLQALPLFLDRLADPITAVVLSVTVVLVFGAPDACLCLCLNCHQRQGRGHMEKMVCTGQLPEQFAACPNSAPFGLLS